MPLNYDPDDEFEDDEQATFEVSTPSGGSMPVASETELAYYERLRDQITSEFEFTVSSDLVDLDHILSMELTIWRLQRQLTKNNDLHGRPLLPIDQTRLQKSMTDTQNALGKAKAELGISKVSRDKAQDGESIATYLENLRVRAGQFGIHRNNQVTKALALINEVCSKADSFLRMNELERSKFGFQTAEDVLVWIVTEVLPEYNEIDEKFRENGQKFWIGTV